MKTPEEIFDDTFQPIDTDDVMKYKKDIICAMEEYANQFKSDTVIGTINASDFHKLIVALEEIAQGRGRYSEDRLKHAENTIADMIEIAQNALNDFENRK